LIRVNALTGATLEFDSLLFNLDCAAVVSSAVIQDTGTVLLACGGSGVYALDAMGSDLSTARLRTSYPRATRRAPERPASHGIRTASAPLRYAQ
jgi:hypothetical protein